MPHLLVALLLSVGLMALGSDIAAGVEPPARPNIVVLETDDQTVESLRVMPNVQRLLAAHGVTFDSSFVGYSLCCPSRATLLTGQYAHNHGVLGNVEPVGGYEKLDSSNTLPVWLQKAGYATVHLGKYLNGYGNGDQTMIPPGWSEWHGAVEARTYFYYGVRLNEDGKLTTYDSDYMTDLYTRKAVDIIRLRAASPRPFFLWVAFVAPHSGFPIGPGHPLHTPLPAPRHFGRFASEPLPAPPSFNEQDVSDKPSFLRELPPLDAASAAEIVQRYRLELESLLAVDDAVDEIVQALATSGELGNTVLVFTSDNGYMHGEHRIPWEKAVVYEPSIRVPLIVRGPGVPAGVHLRQPVSNIDLAPTFVDLAGATAGRTMDGRSLLPLFSDPGLQWGRDLLVEARANAGHGGLNVAFQAIRTPRYLYARYQNGERELYDLVRDPYQLVNRDHDPANTRIRNELARRLSRLAVCEGQRCREGPAVTLAVRCRDGRLTTSLFGPDVRLVVYVDFLVDGRKVARARTKPFRRSLRPGKSVRATSLLADGRLVTRDRRAPRCLG
jgi:N-acetylglucosamine-6-sulfatase